jgi:hypothetical protein
MSYVAKTSLTINSRPFFSLNVSQKIYSCISPKNNTSLQTTKFLDAYLLCSPLLQSKTLIDVAICWSYGAQRKNEKWKLRETKAIPCVILCYCIILAIDAPS